MSHAHIRRGAAPLIISVLGAGFVAGLIPAGLLPANVLNIEHTYNLSHAQMGRIVGLCMILGGGTGGLLGGWLCGRIGALKNMLLSLVLAAAALGCVALIRNYTATVGGLAGYFFAMGFMASSNVLATQMLPDRQRGVALLHALNATGKLAGPVLASLFIYGAWRNSFLAAAVLPLLLTIPALMAHDEASTTIGRKDNDTGRAGAGFWLAISGFGLIAGSEIAVALWLPAYAEKIRHFTKTQGNLLLSVFLLGLILGRLISGTFSKKISSKQAITACGLCTLFVFPALYFDQYIPVAVYCLLFGFSFSATWPSYFTHLSRVYPEHLGLMGGAAVFSTQIGFALCSAASGRLAEIHLAYPMLFGAAVMAAFIIAFFLSPISKDKRKELKEHDI